MLFFPLLTLLLGLAILVKGADWLVDGASSIAKRLKVSDLVIGLTIVSLGTSAPEFFVSVVSSLKGDTEIAIGNVLGSNIANVFLILGISAIIRPLAVTRGTVWKEIPLSLLAAILVGVMANDIYFNNDSVSVLSRNDGITLVAFFIIFLYYTYSIAKNGEAKNQKAKIEKLSLAKSIIFVAIGIMALTLGGNWVVDSAISIAIIMGVSETFIALTVIAVGTSLPELVTSAIAAYKGNSNIAIGNVVGSNIFNVFWILGVSSIISPLPFNPENNFSVLMAIGASLSLLIMMFIGKRHHLERRDGIVYVMLYAGYIAYLVAGR